MSLIKLENVSKYYKSAETVSVGMQKVNLTFDIGEFVAITGESGAGKSTLLNVLSGLDKYEEGEYFLNGEETSHFTIRDWEKFRGAYIGFVFQDYNIIDSYTVLQNVLLALEVQGYDPTTRKQRALDLIDRVGLTSHKNHKASKLSGGQKQRCVIARALAKDCPIIVADEPTGNLDSKSGEQVLELLHEISENKLVVIVTHDYEHVEHYVTRKITMRDGEVLEDKKIKEAYIQEAKPVKPIKNMSFGLLFRFAIRNLLATPKKLIFMLLMQIIVVSVFTLVYTNQISSIRETGLNPEYTDVYPSVPETRVLIEKRDGSTFTTDEVEMFEKNSYVNDVYEYGLNFFNSRGVYYKEDPNYEYYTSFGDTDTASSLIASDVEGDIPTALNEIVLPQYNAYDLDIGDMIQLYQGSGDDFYYYEDFGDYDYEPLYTYYNADTYDLIGSFVITGFDKLDRGRTYFSDAFLNQPYPVLVDPYLDFNAYQSLKSKVAGQIQVSVDDMIFGYYQIYDDISYDITIDSYSGSNVTVEEKTLDFEFKFIDSQYGSFTITKTDLFVGQVVDEIDDNSLLLIQRDLFEDVIDEIMLYFEDYYTSNVPNSIISLSVDGRHDATKLIENVDQNIYKVYYPANLADPMRDFLVFLYSVLAIFFLFLFGIFLYTIVHAVTKNVMTARKRDFAIFRSVGTSQATLGRLVVLEQVIMNVFAFVITIIGIQLISQNVSLIRSELSYMEFGDYVSLLLAFALFGAWLGLRFNRKVFKQTVIESLTSSKAGE